MINGNNLRRNPIFKKRKVELVLTTGIMTPGTGIVKSTKSETPLVKKTDFASVPTGQMKIETFTKDITTTMQVIPPQYEKLTCTLTEVSSLDISSTASTGMYTGAVATVIQPWYFQPVTVIINGRSYMGAFDNDSYNIGVDNDVAQIIKMRKMINDDFLRSDLADKLNVKLTITSEPSNTGSVNKATIQQFFGIMDEIRIGESEDNPYVQEYTVKFVGEYSDSYALKQGFKGLRSDVSLSGSASTYPISSNTSQVKVVNATPVSPRD